MTKDRGRPRPELPALDKANFCRGRQGRCCSQSGQTKPIVPRWPEIGADRQAGEREPAGGQLCETKPISATVPIGRSAFPEGQSGKIKPIWRDGARGMRGVGFLSRSSTLRPLPSRLYKQSQSAGGIPHRSTIPPFQHSSPMPVVRNKANSGTDPNGRGSPGSQTLPPQTRILRNKANPPRTKVMASALYTKSYDEFKLHTRSGETKPISRVGGSPRVACCTSTRHSRRTKAKRGVVRWTTAPLLCHRLPLPVAGLLHPITWPDDRTRCHRYTACRRHLLAGWSCRRRRAQAS